MKKRSAFNLLAALILIPVFICSCAPPARILSPEITNIKNMTPPNGKALVYIVRPGGIYGFALIFEITCDEREIGAVGPKQFIYTVLDPGTHKFAINGYDDSELFLSVQANQVYYFADRVQTGLARVDLDEGTGLLKKSNLSADCLAYKVNK